MEERGLLPGSTRFAMGKPLTSFGAKLKSVNSLFNKKPPTLPRSELTINLEPKLASMVVVMATARPWASTTLMWLVPYSVCVGMGAKLVVLPPGCPAGADFMAWVPISWLRSRR